MLRAAECEIRAEEFDARAKDEANVPYREMFGQIAEGYRDLARRLRAREAPVEP